MFNSDEFWIGFCSACFILLFLLLIDTTINQRTISDGALQQLPNIQYEQVKKGK